MQFQGEGMEPLVCVCEFEINNYGGFWLLNESNLKYCVLFCSVFLNITLRSELFDTGYCSRLWFKIFSLSRP